MLRSEPLHKYLIVNMDHISTRVSTVKRSPTDVFAVIRRRKPDGRWFQYRWHPESYNDDNPLPSFPMPMPGTP